MILDKHKNRIRIVLEDKTVYWVDGFTGVPHMMATCTDKDYIYLNTRTQRANYTLKKTVIPLTRIFLMEEVEQ